LDKRLRNRPVSPANTLLATHLLRCPFRRKEWIDAPERKRCTRASAHHSALRQLLPPCSPCVPRLSLLRPCEALSCPSSPDLRASSLRPDRPLPLLRRLFTSTSTCSLRPSIRPQTHSCLYFSPLLFFCCSLPVLLAVLSWLAFALLSLDRRVLENGACIAAMVARVSCWPTVLRFIHLRPPLSHNRRVLPHGYNSKGAGFLPSIDSPGANTENCIRHCKLNARGLTRRKAE